MYRHLLKLLRHLVAALALSAGTSLAYANQTGILVLGDSISAAYGMSLEQGWVSLLETRLRETAFDVEIVNASISGETSAGALRRLPELLAQHQPDLLIVQLGGNDGLRGYPIKSLRQNLASITSMAKESGALVILLPMEIPPNYGERYASAFRESFATVAQQESVTLGPFILEKFATDPAMMQADGIHPVVAAQMQMLDTVFPSISSILAAQ